MKKTYVHFPQFCLVKKNLLFADLKKLEMVGNILKRGANTWLNLLRQRGNCGGIFSVSYFTDRRDINKYHLLFPHSTTQTLIKQQ